MRGINSKSSPISRFGHSQPFAFLAGGALLLLAQQASARPSNKHRVFHKQTAHYRIECDISRAATDEIAQHMEAIFKEYLARLKDFGGTIRGRFSVKVYNNQEDYLRKVGEKLGNTGGYYMSRKKLLAAHLSGRSLNDLLRTLYHEGFHQFTDVFLGGIGFMPPWVSEGMAQLFEDATWNGKRFEIGEVPTGRLRALEKSRSSGNWIPLRDLVSLTSREWSKNLETDLPLGVAEYNESWSVIHFLVYAENGKYRHALIQYLRRLNSGETAYLAFQKSFGKNLSGFERRWNQYLDALKPSAKFVCRQNLLRLALALPWANQNLSVLDNIAAFRTLVEKTIQRGGWLSDGEKKISSDTPEQIRALFKCPLDRDEPSANSYELLEVSRQNSDGDKVLNTVLLCRRHKGIVLLGYVVKNRKTGKYHSRITEDLASKWKKKKQR